MVNHSIFGASFVYSANLTHVNPWGSCSQSCSFPLMKKIAYSLRVSFLPVTDSFATVFKITLPPIFEFSLAISWICRIGNSKLQPFTFNASSA